MTDHELDAVVAAALFPEGSPEAADPPLFSTTWGGCSALALRMREAVGVWPWRAQIERFGLSRTYRGFAVAAVLAAQANGSPASAA